MKTNFTLYYWIEDGWYLGKLKELPGVFGYGRTLDDLEANIKEAYKLVAEEKNKMENLNNIHQKIIQVNN